MQAARVLPIASLTSARGRGHPVVGREGRDQDQVDLVGVDPGDGDRPAAGDGGHRGGRFVGGGDVPLLDPGPGDDPFVGGVDHPLEVGVGEDRLGA